MQPSQTAYDDSFRTLLNDCSQLIIPVVNDAFGENYTGKEKVLLSPNELFLNQDDGVEEKRITDSNFVIVSSDGSRKRYHIECEANVDDTIIVRLFEYDAQLALGDGIQEGNTFTVTFPNSAVMALRHTQNTPDTMLMRIVTPGGKVEYFIPFIKVQNYSIAELFEKKLLFFLPFYIFSHERQFPIYESDQQKLKKLTDEYVLIRTKLDDLVQTGDLDAYVKNAICAMITHVLALITERYNNVQEGVKQIMSGKIIDYEAKTILRQGIAQGKAEGIAQGKAEGIVQGKAEAHEEDLKLALAETEERARDMLRDRMELPLVEKYTRLSMPRIQELARELGVI